MKNTPGGSKAIFVGLDNLGLFSSFDNGKNWIHDSTISNDITQYAIITDFAFKDSLVGWLSLLSDFSDTVSCCYKTTNGGISWLPSGPNRAGRGIYYNPISDRVCVSTWRGDLTCSSDEGATWQDYPISSSNGYALTSRSCLYGRIKN